MRTYDSRECVRLEKLLLSGLLDYEKQEFLSVGHVYEDEQMRFCFETADAYYGLMLNADTLLILSKRAYCRNAERG
jgi:hypothetical protein